MDGAYDATTGEGGIGIVIRDSKGAILLSAWQFVGRGQDAEEMEALACTEGLLLEKEWCPSRAILETDCSSMVRALSVQEEQRSRLKFIIDEAKGAGEGLTEWAVVHTRRESNGVAHELAQLAKRNWHSAVWRFVAPECVEQLVAQFSSQKKK